MSQREEKRLHPRVPKRLRVQSQSREELELETIDLSAGGMRVTSAQFIPLMTKMELSMVLPSASGASPDARRVVRGEAVVVRSEPDTASKTADAGYSVALFFSRMDEGDRQILQDFLKDRNGK